MHASTHQPFILDVHLQIAWLLVKLLALWHSRMLLLRIHAVQQASVVKQRRT
jgi:hypothetical protein